MCCLFGLLDYNNTFSSKNKNTIISVLSIESEARGKDATGIAYNANGKMSIYKRASPAHKLHYAIPKSSQYIMGHTRMTTQGSEKFNYNNHPFMGNVQSSKFALAHNGILYNDISLRNTEALPKTNIQTDSFIAVQLIEKQRILNFESLAKMAEKVEGSFTFTVLDSYNNLYIVKGNSPFSLYHFPKKGFYLYASTEEILKGAITTLGLQDLKREDISLNHGDILEVDSLGKLKRSSFEVSDKCLEWENTWYSYHNKQKSRINASYIRELKSIAFYYGYSSDYIDNLIAYGFSCEEIEEIICDPEMFYLYEDEIKSEYSMFDENEDYKIKERKLCRQM